MAVRNSGSPMRGTSGHRNGVKFAGWVKERAGNRCERCRPEDIHVGQLSVHHLTYDRIMREKLTDFQLLCDHHHEIADREREQDAREAYEEAGEEAMAATGWTISAAILPLPMSYGMSGSCGRLKKKVTIIIRDDLRYRFAVITSRMKSRITKANITNDHQA
jgi:hypothetical protein